MAGQDCCRIGGSRDPPSLSIGGDNITIRDLLDWADRQWDDRQTDAGAGVMKAALPIPKAQLRQRVMEQDQERRRKQPHAVCRQWDDRDGGKGGMGSDGMGSDGGDGGKSSRPGVQGVVARVANGGKSSRPGVQGVVTKAARALGWDGDDGHKGSCGTDSLGSGGGDGGLGCGDGGKGTRRIDSIINVSMSV